MPHTKKGRKVVVFSVISLGLVALTLAAVLTRREPVITVQTEPVTRRDLTELVVANGKIQPVTQVKISAEVSGEITELPFKEGEAVRKGQLLVRIKPDLYVAGRDSARASYNVALAGRQTAEANLVKAEAEFRRNQELFARQLISESVFTEVKAAVEIARAQATQALHQVEMARAALERAEEDLRKTTIYSPLDGTITRLNSLVGERVVGTALMAGTEILTVADLNEMEARVDIGETDIVLVAKGQKARLEVDAFKDRRFTGRVTEIANSSRPTGPALGSQSQEATKFEVRIRIEEKEAFRPGMSVSAEIETRYRTNVLTVPLASVTTRLPTEGNSQAPRPRPGRSAAGTNAPASAHSAAGRTNAPATNKKSKDTKPIEAVFVREGDRVRLVPVTLGVSDDSYWEITEGLKEGQEVVSGGFKAISRDLQDGSRIRIGKPEPDQMHDTK